MNADEIRETLAAASTRAAERDPLALLAQGWDAGYDAAATLMEAGILRLAVEGKRGLRGMKRPENPYRPSPTQAPSGGDA